jgi:hypothetical protein
VCVRRERARSRARQIDAAGAEFDHDQLHDALQFSSGELPSLLRRAFLVRWDVIRLVERDVIWRQHHGQRIMFGQLFNPTAGVSDDLRAHFTIPVN